ncbi:putative amino acid transporter, transmembrane domain-containing protein [Rosa chinensis]|uniref:Putative amino acid transporter, transmembrane domain-containing protein n=1 Tax=Rosa chinensis TaxID=74649 RepID=A0A2P6Q051_ROSCH|nr:putative amino acid transporter, transmembrane domain-containing protein [Rosa chinensis]
MALSEVKAEFQHDLSESDLNNPAKNVEAGEELLVDDDGKLKRTVINCFNLCDHAGTVWTASAHIITTSIGAGVLSLAWAMAQLGWLARVFILLFCTFTAGYASTLLADCYRYPDPVSSKRNCSYMETVKVYLGGTMHMICGWILYLDLAAIGVGFTITTANSLVAIQKSNCHRKNGEDSPCMFSYIPHMVGFGLVEILSQLENFHKLTWLSKLAAIMSFVYATIGIGLSLAKIISGKFSSIV